MGVLQSNNVSSRKELVSCHRYTRRNKNYFWKGTSLIKSFPPLMLSARKTLPVVAIATMCECSLKGLKEIGS